MEHQFFQDLKFYQDKKTGYWISTSYPRRRMHLIVYESFFGKIPKGHHVHHKDGNKSNNSIENLEIMTIKEHLSLHSSTPENKERNRKWVEIIRPLTKAWHSSAAGQKWHKRHGQKTWINRKAFEMECLYCHKKYFTKTYHQTFCSNKCKSASRRSSGIDNIEVKCDYCGKCFIKSKYSKATCCSRACGCKMSWSKGERNQTCR